MIRRYNVARYPVVVHYTGMRKKNLSQFKVVIERDEDGYFVATVPALPGCHTQGKTMQELQKNVREVVALCLAEAKAKAGLPPMIFRALMQS